MKRTPASFRTAKLSQSTSLTALELLLLLFIILHLPLLRQELANWHSFQLQYYAPPTEAPPQLNIAGQTYPLTLHNPVQVTLAYPQAGPLFRLGYYFSLLFYYLVLLGSAGLFLRIIYSSMEKGRFSLTDARRFQWIGLALAALGVVEGLRRMLGSYFVHQHMLPPLNEWNDKWEVEMLTDRLSFLILGLAAYSMGKVFENGARLQEDQDLTI